MWQEMKAFSYPTNAWDYRGARFLFYCPDHGVVIGVCILEDAEDADNKDYSFRDGERTFSPTHWMPLPPAP
jgi:hypothetical protein